MNKYITTIIFIVIFVIVFNLVYNSINKDIENLLEKQCLEKDYDFVEYYNLDQASCCIKKGENGSHCIQVIWNGNFWTGKFDIPHSDKLRNMKYEVVKNEV